MRQAFARPIEETVPPRLAAIFAEAAQGGRDGGAQIIPLRRRPELRRALLPLAASVLALVVGFAAGVLAPRGDGAPTLMQASASGEDPAEAEFLGALYRALDGGAPTAGPRGPSSSSATSPRRRRPAAGSSATSAAARARRRRASASPVGQRMGPGRS